MGKWIVMELAEKLFVACESNPFDRKACGIPGRPISLKRTRVEMAAFLKNDALWALTPYGDVRP
jgi:hypothetical protein